MIEAEYRARLKNMLCSLGIDGANSDIVIENKAQDCEMQSICREYSAEEAFDIDIQEGREVDED